jgi:hypoxanthine-guanine phosphoribosyltransferase
MSHIDPVVYDASAACDVEDLRIVEHPALEALLFDRNRVRGDFARACLQSSRVLVRHLGRESFGDGVSELILLSKGLVYQIQAALLDEFDLSIPVNLMATSRVSVGSESSEIAVPYAQLDAGGQHLVIGDTVASGSTVIAAIQQYRRSWDVESLTILSLCGSKTGAQVISQYCMEASIRVRFLYGLAAFGLGANGFDLSFLDPDTVASQRYRARAAEQFEGHPVSAVGWDFGSQVMAPQKYAQLCWLEAERWGLHGHPSLRLEEPPPDNRLISKELSALEQ